MNFCPHYRERNAICEHLESAIHVSRFRRFSSENSINSFREGFFLSWEDHSGIVFEQHTNSISRLNTFSENWAIFFPPHKSRLLVRHSSIIDTRQGIFLPLALVLPYLLRSSKVPGGEFNYQVLLLLKGETILSKRKIEEFPSAEQRHKAIALHPWRGSQPRPPWNTKIN